MRRSGGLVLFTGIMACLAGLLLHVNQSDDGQRFGRHRDTDVDPILLDADEAGAIVLRDDNIVGVDRQGRTAWTVSDLEHAYLTVICANACPSGVLSGDRTGTDMSSDPAPKATGASVVPLGWDEQVFDKNNILVNDGDHAVRLVAKGGKSSWQFWDGSTLQSKPAPGSSVSWFPTADDTAGVASIYSRDDNTYVSQVLVRGTKGWRFTTGPTANPNGSAACVASQGRTWMIDGRNIGQRSGSVRLRANGEFGNCTFTKSGLVLSSNTVRGDAFKTMVVTVDPESGHELWRHQFAGEFFVIGDTTSDRFVIMGGDHTARILDLHGKVLATIPNSSFALFDGRGDLVTVSPEGTVSWRRVK